MNIAPEATSSDVLKQFVVNLVQEKQLGDLDPEVVREIESELEQRLEDLIHARILESLSDEQQAEFERMLNADASESDTQTYLQEHIPNFTNVVASVLVEFRTIYLG